MEIVVTIGYKDKEMNIIGEYGNRRIDYTYKDDNLPITVHSASQIISEVRQFNRVFIGMYIIDVYCKPKFSLWGWLNGKLPEWRSIEDVISDDCINDINNWNAQRGKSLPTYSGFKTITP